MAAEDGGIATYIDFFGGDSVASRSSSARAVLGPARLCGHSRLRLTETAPMTNYPFKPSGRARTCGLPLMARFVRGQTVTSGYFKAPHATRAALDGACSPTPETWARLTTLGTS